NGADLILGHHSHTLQPIEYVTASDGRQVLCTYSLGNLLSGMARPVRP
ncbi:MAG: CapA family protein, partial [Clostridia bacterium]|nr:CapA family protein [Clostridia bacterium]